MKRVKGIPIPRENVRSEIQDLPPAGRIVLPLITRFGEMTPIVSVGDELQAGQLIAKGSDKWVPPLLASVTGQISAIKAWPNGTGNEGPALVIRSPQPDTLPTREIPSRNDLPEVMRWIQAADIREVDPDPMPPALRLRKPELVPPAFTPFSPALEKPIHTIIINGIDRQPGVWIRKAMTRISGKTLLETIPLLKDLTGASRVFFTFTKGAEPAQEFLQGLREHGAEPVSCPNIYPIGLKPLLVRYLTGQELPVVNSEGAREFGMVVVDVATALKVHGTAHGELSSLQVVVQVTAPSAGIDTLVRVRQGTLIEDVLDALSISKNDLAKVLCGGPFLGTALHRLDVPVTQEMDSIILQTEQEIIHYTNEPCVNCGYCVRRCPMKLLPNELSKNCEYGRFNVAESLDIFSCIECGICAYVCPVHRPMVQLICFGKREIESARKES